LPGKGDILAIHSHAAFSRDDTTDVEDDNTRALGDCQSVSKGAFFLGILQAGNVNHVSAATASGKATIKM
jgi:hypothetical protein